jgi:SNF2 family DNA or RNA helicase
MHPLLRVQDSNLRGIQIKKKGEYFYLDPTPQNFPSDDIGINPQCIDEVRVDDVYRWMGHSIVYPECSSRDLSKLYTFQKEGVHYLMRNRKSLLADDMGLGKTIQVLHALEDNKKVLVVTPAFLKRNWYHEIQKWVPTYRATVIDGKKNFRLPEAGEIVIVNYDILPDEILSVPDYLIADEAHYLKNCKAKRYKNFKKISDKVINTPSSSIWLLTGTPLLNKPPDLWALMHILHWCKPVFGTYQNFMRLFNARFNGKYTMWGKVDDRVRGILSKYYLRRMKVDVLPDLPEKIYRQIFVAPPPKEKYALCSKVLDKCSEIDEEYDLLMQKTYDFPELSEARKILAESKVKDLHELVDDLLEKGEIPLVFSAHTTPILSFKKKEGWGCITGEVNAKNREELARKMQEGSLMGLAATIQAAGIGLNLTRVTHVIFVDQTFVPAINQQAEDRVMRIGKTTPCCYTYLISDHPLDKLLHRVIMRKNKLVNSTIQSTAINFSR